MQRDFWFHCLRLDCCVHLTIAFSFDEIVLMWLRKLNLFFTVTSRVIQWQVPQMMSRGFSATWCINLPRQSVAADGSPGGGCNFEVVGEHVGCKTTPTFSPFRSPGQSGGYWSSAGSSSVEGQADWTSAPCLPLRRLLCSSSEPLSCTVLSRSLHQPKMQCSSTTNQITGDIAVSEGVRPGSMQSVRVDSAMSIALALSVLCMSLRGQDAHLQVATLLQVQDVWWDVVQFIAPTLTAVHRDPPDLNE